MKKIIKKVFIVISVVFCIALCACDKSGNTDKTQNTDNAENTSQRVTFSADDLALFSTQGIGELLVNLYMDQDQIPYDTQEDLLNSFSIKFQEANGKNKVKYIYFRGNPIPVQTVKGISTTGLDYLNYELCSDEEDVIKNYDLDDKSEEIYTNLSSDDSKSKFIALYFSVDNDGNVVRNKYPKGMDISDFNALDSNAYIYFEIKDAKVIGIIMGCK